MITGASSGLGLETARALAPGNKLILTGRNLEKLLTATADIDAVEKTLLDFDISDLDQVKANAAKISKLDILINNAGVMGPQFSRSAQGFEYQMATNYLGHFLLTKLLWPVLETSSRARVISLSSVVHRKGKITPTAEVLAGSEQGYDRWQRYADTKLACLLFARELDLRAKQAGSKTLSIAAHPGWASTGLQVHTPSKFDALAQTAAQGARSQLLAATADYSGGEFIGPNLELWGAPKQIKGSKLSNDADLANKLWIATEDVLKTKFLL